MKPTTFLFQKGFVDKVRLSLTGGNGANGNPKYRGKGGNGGNIFLVGNNKAKLENIRTSYPSFQIKADNGKECSRTNIIGTSGKNVFIEVPTGIEISQNSDQVFGTISKTNDKMIVCRGGSGGGPLNNYMAQPGEKLSIFLNLKLIADVGLVGFPNAGKSSFLKSISGMNVRVANYAFTTMKPQVADIKFPDGRMISIADLPGIIEGAHVNVGLGHHFLKHIERTKLMLFVIDIYGFRLHSKRLETRYRSPLETILLLNQELELYSPMLMDKPCLCLLNKVDQKDGNEISEFLTETISQNKLNEWISEEVCPQKLVKFEKVISISAKTGFGLEDVKLAIRESLDKIALQEAENDAGLADFNQEFQESTQSLI